MLSVLRAKRSWFTASCTARSPPRGSHERTFVAVAGRQLKYSCTSLFFFQQEEAEQKAKEAKKKAEAAIAKRVAEEMGMGSVGQTQGIMLTAQRIKRKMAGEHVRKALSGHVTDADDISNWCGVYGIKGLVLETGITWGIDPKGGGLRQWFLGLVDCASQGL